MNDSDDDEDDVYSTMTFGELMTKLMKKSSPVLNDRRQQRYCRYVNSLLSLYGDEQCILVGSTAEGSRLRSNQDDGDFDYLMVSEIQIRTKYLYYNDNLPCVVHIDGRKLRDELPVELVHGKYLPSNLLKTVSREAFTGIRGIVALASLASVYHGQDISHITMDTLNKPGVTLTNYTDWLCDELPVTQSLSSINQDKVYELFQKEVNSTHMLHTDSGVIEVLRKLAFLAKSLTKNQGYEEKLFQYIFTLVQAIADDVGNKNQRRNKESKTASRNGSCDKKTGKGNAESGLSDLSSFTRQCEGSTSFPEDKALTNEDTETVFYASYRWKSQKNFIPAFSLDGPPKYMDTWRARVCNNAWPGSDVIDSIYNGEFYVVGKPDMQERPDKCDFILSYNSAEIQLAASMYPAQRKCLLTLKAFQRSKLEEFGDKLTTYHWKTALYWVSEVTDYELLVEDNEDNSLGLLKAVLTYMLKSLRELKLQHYFIPSNLIVDWDVRTRDVVVEKLSELLHDPLGALREFFRYEDVYNSSVKTIEITPPHMARLRKSMDIDRDEFVVEMIVCALEQFVREPPQADDNGGPMLKRAVLRVTAAICTDMTKDIQEKGKPVMVPVERIMKTLDNYLSASEARTQETMQALFTVFELSGLLTERK